MQIKEFLESVCQQIKYKPIRSEIADEIKCHIEETKEELMLSGMEELKAEEEAVSRMGDSEKKKKKLNKIHKPKLEWKILFIIFIMMGFGNLILLIKINAMENIDNIGSILLKFYISLVIGFVCSIAIYFMDYRKILTKSKYLYIFASILMIYHFFFGVTIDGRIWINFSFLSVSVSTITIPLYIIAFARIYEQYRYE